MELLEEGELVITQRSGLLRYRTGDRVKVDSFVGNCPTLTFLGRSGKQVDMHGEKLTEERAYKSISPLLDNCPSILLPVYESSENSYYCLMIESFTGNLKSLADKVDNALKENFHYAVARRNNQLKALQVCLMDRLNHKYTEIQMSSGMRWGDIKIPFLELKIQYESELKSWFT